MKKQLLFLFGLLSCQVFAYGQTGMSDIHSLRIAELEYHNDSLFLLQEIRPKMERMDTTHGSVQHILLPEETKEHFLQLVETLQLLSISSNNQKTNGHFPFEIHYERNGNKQSISAYRAGMTAEEAEHFDRYQQKIKEIIDFDKVRKDLLATMPDGIYQFRSDVRYELMIGPSGWDSWEKQGKEIIRRGVPLLIVDGKERNADMLHNLDKNSIKSIEVLKDPREAETRYGSKAKDGAVVVTTK